MCFTSFSRPGGSSLVRALVLLAVGALWLGGGSTARAQIQMDLSLSRHQYILYEPLIATVTITNNAGRDIVLEDAPGKPWLNMEVTTLEGELLSPYDPDMHLRPVTIPAGQTVKRQIDLTPLFPIRDMGEHRVRADLYFADSDHFFYTNYVTFGLTSGKTIWRQTVGVPGSPGDLREASLVINRLNDRMLLYARVRDANGDTVYVTRSLGRMVETGREPEVMLDRDNTMHVLQEAAPGQYLYTVVNINGDRLNQRAYQRVGQSRPTLTKNAGGDIAIRGGQPQALPGPDGAPPEPKLSDRPPGLPLPPKAQGE